MPELIVGLSSLWLVLLVLAGVLLFFLPFYVAGIYNRVVKCQEELEKLNRSIGVLKNEKEDNLNKDDKIKLKIAERAKDPNSILHKKI